MRLGITANPDPSTVVSRIQRAERAGLDSGWITDHFTHWFPDRTYAEPWAALCVAAVNTTRILLSSCVSDVFRRSPALLAQCAATLDQFSSGRGILGLGAGEKMNIAPFGIKMEQPVARMKETVKIVRDLWRSNINNQVTFSGKFNQLEKAFLAVSPAKGRAMPIYIAASSERTRKVAGEMGDGWLASVETPESFSEGLRVVLEAAKSAGRMLDTFDTVAFVPFAISNDAEAARKALARAASFQLVFAGDRLRGLGFHLTIPRELSGNDVILDKTSVEGLLRLSKQVPMSAIEQVSAVGSPDQCISALERFAKAGAKHVVLSLPASADLTESLDLLHRYVLPHTSKM